MHKYELIIYWSNEDGAFVAEVPVLAGCAAHGDSQETALQRVNEAIDLWLGHGNSETPFLNRRANA